MPRPTKPLVLKAISGTIQAAHRANIPLVEYPSIDETPPAPDWLPNVHAKKEWDRLAPILVANKLLTDAGLSAFGVLCALHGKLVQLWSAGEAPNAAMIAQYRNVINDFGLTPVAQGKIRPVGEAPTANKFSERGQRAA